MRAHANVGKDVKMVDTAFTAWAALKIRSVNLGSGVGRCCWILEAVFGGWGGVAVIVSRYALSLFECR